MVLFFLCFCFGLVQNANAIIQIQGTRKQSFYTIMLFIWFICTICAAQQTNCNMCENGKWKESIDKSKQDGARTKKEKIVKNLQSSLSCCKFAGFRPKGEFRSDHGIIYVSITSNIQMESDCDCDIKRKQLHYWDYRRKNTMKRWRRK